MLVEGMRQAYSSSPVKGLNWLRGDIAWNVYPSASGPPGWVCVRRFDTTVRIQANEADTIIELNSTSGVATSDPIYILMDNGTYHLATVSNVIDDDTLVISAGIPAGRSVPVGSEIRTFRFKAMANLTS